MITAAFRSVTLAVTLTAQGAQAQTSSFFDDIFPPGPNEEQICEMTRQAMDKFLQGRDRSDIEIPDNLEALGISPETGKAYIVARCPYTPPEEHQNEQPTPKTPEPAFFGV